MPQDAPADTAGPSSPPPRMPEGWLPQWEGVQRKWYYVQRATGKSQWEIPTEPVVLTPSTTPTSIGTGPSQAPPSRPSTNSPRMTALTNTLAERIEAAAASARTSSSLDAQLNGQPAATSLGYPGKSGWYQDQTGQHLGYPYGQTAPLTESGYSSGLHHHGASGNMNIDSPSYYPGNPLANHVGQQPFMGNSWGHNSNLVAGQASGYNLQQHQDPYQNLAIRGSQPLHHMEAYPSSVAIPEGQISDVRADQTPPQPQWRVEQQPMHQNTPHYAVSTNPGSTNPSRPYIGSYPTPQTSGWSSGEFTSRSSLSSEHSHPGSDHNSNRSAQQANHSMSRSQSHHSPFHQQAAPSHMQYSGANLAGSQSGTGLNSMVVPPGPEAQAIGHFYQNSLAQLGPHQYLPQQQPSNPGGNMPGVGYPHQYIQTTGQYNDWPGTDSHLSRISASDPQFVSGPWGSTPSTSGPPPSTRYE
ncbi:uncharacterized protein N7484_006509 [Penicillium longicatenatum]|uniref:uncharacterized protein n=1 Tax=Penicillium longicatenatum TaxID=1561947 RepID=UPI0025470C6B|nr:uncharacterized protein N7484_006509 [Penicillium longicatenatum]KAJ5644002.1 hypothetical protein N7484_006509 [Penicillium longicatenatum]